MSDPIQFTVLGKPEPAGSKRAFVNPRTGKMIVSDANPKGKPWKSSVAAAGAEAMAGRPLMGGPVRLSIVFYRPRPIGHYGTGRNASIVKRSAPAWPLAKPDVLKLARAVEDALTGIVWRDDAQIVDERLMKCYGEPAHCFVAIEPLAAPFTVTKTAVDPDFVSADGDHIEELAA